MRIVRFECGCIGSEPVDGFSDILDACDGEGGVCPHRNMKDKLYTPVNPSYSKVLLGAVADAATLRELRGVLKYMLRDDTTNMLVQPKEI